MGANTFVTAARGKTATDAFKSAVAKAQFDRGHGGYTGTIAEKLSFEMIAMPDGVEPTAYAQKLIEEEDQRIDDKWGPAGCIALGDGQYLFFGWASS